MKRSKNLYLTIYQLIRAGDYPNKIAKDLDISKQKVKYYTDFLQEREIIRKLSKTNPYAGWEVIKDLTEKELLKEVKKRSKKISSLGVRERDLPLTDVHAFNIRFPILSGELKDKDWEIKNKLNNWLPKYKKFDNFKGLTIRNNNNKSITVMLKARKIDLIKDPYAVEKLGIRIKAYMHEYFKSKHEVSLDVFEAETKNIHLETQDNDKLDGVLKKGEVFEVDLGKKAAKIFHKDNRDAKAWADNSPDPNMIATNDTDYKRDLLFMPVRTKENYKLLSYIAENYASHVGVVEKLNKILEEPKAKKHIRKKTNSNQTKLTDF